MLYVYLMNSFFVLCVNSFMLNARLLTYLMFGAAPIQMHPTLKKLVDMGFPEDVARKALLDSNGDENAAIEVLLSSM